MPRATDPAWIATSLAPKLHLTAKSCRTFFEQRLAEAGASFATWTVLAALTAEGPMIQRALAKTLSIEGPTLSRHLEGMQSRDLITRTTVDGDRRAAAVELTELGRQTYERLSTVAMESNKQLLDGLNPAQVTELGRLLDLIRENTKGVHR